MSGTVVCKVTRSFVFTADLHCDVKDRSVSFDVPIKIAVPGKWWIAVRGQDNGTLRVELNMEDTIDGCLGRDVIPTATFAWVRGSESKEIRTGIWLPYKTFPKANQGIHLTGLDTAKFQAAEAADPSYKTASHRHYRIAFSFPGAELPAGLKHAVAFSELARRNEGLNDTQSPHDVRFFFPHVGTEGAELWGRSSTLSIASPYFKTLLNTTDFVESRKKTRKRLRTAEIGPHGASEDVDIHSEAEIVRSDFADSDEESDDFLVKKQKLPLVEELDEGSDLPYREIKIPQTAFATYRATLAFLATSHINFAPLSSSFLPSNSSAKQTRLEYLQSVYDELHSRSIPVSPKSVYRLAHLLDMPELVALSLAEVKSCITVENAIVELFSDTSCAYDDVRAMILDFVTENWAAVKDSEALKSMKAKIIAREASPLCGMVAMELLERFAK